MPRFIIERASIVEKDKNGKSMRYDHRRAGLAEVHIKPAGIPPKCLSRCCKTVRSASSPQEAQPGTKPRQLSGGRIVQSRTAPLAYRMGTQEVFISVREYLRLSRRWTVHRKRGGQPSKAQLKLPTCPPCTRTSVERNKRRGITTCQASRAR